MPIKDRTRRRLPRLGVIRLGLLVDNARGGGQHPIQTDYFVLKDAPDIEAFYLERGEEKVRELDVRLPFRDLERNFDAWYQVWAGGVLTCQGDGEYVQYATPMRIQEDKKRTRVYNAPGDTLVSNGVAQVAFDWNGTRFEAGEIVPCPGAAANLYPQCAACRLGALLKVMMADPELFRFGYYQISTGSKRNYDTIMGTLELMPPGQVNAVPFKLRLVEEQVTYQEDGKRKKGTKWFLQLEPDPAITRQIYQRATRDLLGIQQQTAALPAAAGPEWVDYDEDPPLPPPFVVVGADASTGYEGVTDDDNGATPDEVIGAPPYETVPMPENVANYEQVIAQALTVEAWGFRHAGNVMNALANYDKGWKNLPPVNLWQALNDHVAAARVADLVPA